MRFSNRPQTDMEATWNRHQTDRGTTGSDVESDAWGPNRRVPCAFSMSYSIVKELGSRVPRGLGEGKKNVRGLFFCQSGGFAKRLHLGGERNRSSRAAMRAAGCATPPAAHLNGVMNIARRPAGWPNALLPPNYEEATDIL